MATLFDAIESVKRQLPPGEVLSGDEAVKRIKEELEKVGGVEVTPADNGVEQGIASYVLRVFERNRRARMNAGIDEQLVKCSYLSRGEYTPSQARKIREMGQELIFLPITVTKTRAGASWIKDVLLNQNRPTFSLSPGNVEYLPKKVINNLREYVGRLSEKAGEGEPGQAPDSNKAIQASKKIVDEMQKQREVEISLLDSAKKHALHELKILQSHVEKDLRDGGMAEAMSQFIDNFVTYPTAILKGPIVTKTPQVVWEDGEMKVSHRRVARTVSVSPYDVYPSPSSSTPQEGDFIEHIRLGREDVYAMSLIDNGCYDVKTLREILAEGPKDQKPWFNSSIEDDKAQVEDASTSTDASTGVFHGLHFWGFLSGKELKEALHRFSSLGEDMDLNDSSKLYDVEAIILERKLVKLKINKDPLGRRPYYSSSYHKISGSFWGKGIPQLMENIQKVCNATARSLVVNMALSAGPQAEIYTERFDDDDDLEDIYPLKIWQAAEGPGGQSGRAVQFFTVPSVAKELLQVYQYFEAQADEVTGIYRHSYGNAESMGGVSGTAKGMAMVLEAASKQLKEIVRHIDLDVYVPRISQQVQWTIRNNDNLQYSGTVDIIPHGSSTLAAKAALEAKRLQVLQLTTNEFDMKSIGPRGRAEMIRAVSEDAEFPEGVVRDPLELRAKEREEAINRQKQMQIEQQKAAQGDRSLAATKLQIEGQMQMHQGTLQIQMAKLQREAEKMQADLQAKVAQLQKDLQVAQIKAAAEVQGKQVTADAMKESNKLKVASNLANS